MLSHIEELTEYLVQDKFGVLETNTERCITFLKEFTPPKKNAPLQSESNNNCGLLIQHSKFRAICWIYWWKLTYWTVLLTRFQKGFVRLMFSSPTAARRECSHSSEISARTLCNFKLKDVAHSDKNNFICCLW